MWDIGGQESLRSAWNTYYTNAEVCWGLTVITVIIILYITYYSCANKSIDSSSIPSKKGKNLPCFENVNMFTKFHEPINQAPLLLNLGRRKLLTWHPFLRTLTSKTVSQIFGTSVCYFFARG